MVDSLSLSLFGPKLQKQVGSGVGLVGICLAHVEASKVCFQKKMFSKFKSCWKKKNHLFLVFTMVLWHNNLLICWNWILYDGNSEILVSFLQSLSDWKPMKHAGCQACLFLSLQVLGVIFVPLIHDKTYFTNALSKSCKWLITLENFMFDTYRLH